MFKLQHKLKTCLLCLAALFCVALAAQEQRPRVVVLEPRSSGDVPSRVKVAVTGAMEEFILNSKKYRVVDQANTAEILAQHEFARSGLVDNSQAKEIGKLLQADIVCVSVLDREEGEFVIKCRLVDVESGEVFASATEFMESDSTPEIRKAIQIVAMKLTGVENPREAQARDQALKDLTERRLREQQEIERLAREKAIREENEKAERERRQRELEAREAEAKIKREAEREIAERENAIREQAARDEAARQLTIREHEARMNAIKEQEARDAIELARIARESVPPTEQSIRGAKATINRLIQYFTYTQKGRTASCENKVFSQYIKSQRQAILRGGPTRTQGFWHSFVVNIDRGELVISSLYEHLNNVAYLPSAADGRSAKSLRQSLITNAYAASLNIDGKTMRAAITDMKFKNANAINLRSETGRIINDEIVRAIASSYGSSILVTYREGSSYRMDPVIQTAISQTVELYDAMNVLKRAGVKISNQYSISYITSS